MRSLVVLFAFTAVACGSYIPVGQPPHHPAIVLDPHGRPLDTAEVINARALHLQAKALDDHHIIAPVAHSVLAPIAHEVVAPVVVAAPSAVSHQSRVDVHSSPAIVSHSIATPSLIHSAYTPLLGLDHSLNGHGHLLKKRSLASIAYIAPSAVSHQSRVDIVEKPAVVSHSIAAPVIAHGIETPIVAVAHSAVAAPVAAHSQWGASLWGSHAFSHGHLLKKRSLGEILAPVSIALPSAVSHQSRVDIIEQPAVVSHTISAPLIAHAIETPVVALGHSAIAAPLSAHSILDDSLWGSHSLSHGHLLKKRSLGEILSPVSVILPSAVSHQSRVDVIEKPSVVAHAVSAPVVAYSAPLAVAHVAPAAVSHHARLDVTSAHVSPLVHSAAWAVPTSHWSQGGLLDAAHW